jgi:translation initiation factor 1
MTAKRRIPTDGSGAPLEHNPFAALDPMGLPGAPAQSGGAPAPSTNALDAGKTGRGELNRKRGRLEVRRETSGRGGKTVTTVSGFAGIGLPEKEALAKRMQKACGVGGTVKDGRIEIQGDQRAQVAAILAAAGFQPVMAGG